MRILHIGKFFPPHPGGIERSSADLCAAIAQREVAVAMLAHAEPGTHRSRNLQAGKVEVTLAACHGQWVYAPVSPTFPWLLDRTIRRFRPDLLHLHLPNTSAFWALLLPSARRVPWVVHWHSDIPLNSSRRGLRMAYRLYRPWEQAVLRRARAVIATSAPYRDSSVALAPWREKVRVIPLGISQTAGPLPLEGGVGARSAPVGVEAATPTSISDATTDAPPLRSSPPSQPLHSPLPCGSPDGRLPPCTSAVLPMCPPQGGRDFWPGAGLRLLAVGRLSHYKGFHVLLRAVAQTPGTSLVLVGRGECDAELRDLARALEITMRVVFAGQVDDVTLQDLYARADVLCLPSIERSEAFGLVLLEAMRAGLPTIASDIPGSGVGFVVRDRETGLLVPPGDAAALASALLQLANDADLRRHLGAAGHRRWLDEFTLDRTAQRTLALYRDALRENPDCGKARPAS